MFITKKKFGIFKIVNIWFAEKPAIADFSDCDVIIYHTNKDRGIIAGFERINYFSTTINISQNLDEIWRKIKRQHKRHIRRAKNSDTIVTLSNNYEEFYQIHKSFLKRKKYTDIFGLKILPLEFMQKFKGFCLLLKTKMKHWEEIYIFMMKIMHFCFVMHINQREILLMRINELLMLIVFFTGKRSDISKN